MKADPVAQRWRGGFLKLALGAGGLAALTLVAEAAAEPRVAPCVSVRAVARVAYPGYDHIVELTNSCDEVHVCDVATNVSPEVIRVSVDAHGTQSVLTRRGSPAREFTPKAVCTPRTAR